MINFPSNPELNQEYSYESKTWVWNGVGWSKKTSEQGVAEISTYTNLNPTPNDALGIPKGTTFNKRTVQQMFDALLYPDDLPTVTQPTYSLTSNKEAFQEVNSEIDLILTNDFKTGFINPLYIQNPTTLAWEPTANYPRVGTPTYTGEPSGTQQKTILLGTNTYQRTATFEKGEQPKTSKGVDYLKPYPELTATGSLTAYINIKGVYPVFARKTTALAKLALKDHGTNIDDIEVGEGAASEVVIQIPTAWWDSWTGVTVKVWNALSNSYEAMSNPILTSPETIDLTINSQTVSYKQYKLTDDSGANKFKISK